MLITSFRPRFEQAPFVLPTIFVESSDFKSMFMPASVLQAWVVALRSGKFKSGVFKMLNLERNCFCPLGILQMAVSGEVEKDSKGNLLVFPTQEWLDKHSIRFRLPPGVTPINPFNLDEVRIPYLSAVKMFLTTLNDSYDVTQHQMADLIEDHTQVITQ